MRKLHLGTAVSSAMLVAALGSASVQAAPVYNPHGVGDVLLFPYYTTQNDFQTLVHLVNTDSERTILAKVRFREYENSEDVLDFSVILSPDDVLTGYVRQGAAGPQFVKTDNSCTSPTGGVNKVIGFDLAAANDDDDQSVIDGLIAKSHTGHIEVITMGAIQNDLVTTGVIGELEALLTMLQSRATTRPNQAIGTGFIDAFLTNDGSASYQTLLDSTTIATGIANIQGVGIVEDLLDQVRTANAVAFGALHDADGMPGDCGAVDNYFREANAAFPDDADITKLQAAISPTIAGSADEDSAIVNALSGHFVMLNVATGDQGGFSGGSRPLVIRDASTSGMGVDTAGNNKVVINPCGGGEPNLVCGQFVEHYPVPNMANLNGVGVSNATGVNQIRFNELEDIINTANGVSGSRIFNEWSAVTANGVSSEMVVTMPLKHIYMDTTTVAVSPSVTNAATIFNGADDVTNGNWADVDSALRGGEAIFSDITGCVSVNYQSWDREELFKNPEVNETSASGPAEPDTSVTIQSVCNETTVYTFNGGVTQGSAAPGTPVTGLDDIESGWFALNILNQDATISTDITGQAVASTGYSFWSRKFGTSNNNYGHIMDNLRD